MDCSRTLQIAAIVAEIHPTAIRVLALAGKDFRDVDPSQFWSIAPMGHLSDEEWLKWAVHIPECGPCLKEMFDQIWLRVVRVDAGILSYNHNGGCPHLLSLLAFASGGISNEPEFIRHHLESCSLCKGIFGIIRRELAKQPSKVR